jgi:hypothetical protein
MVNSACFSYSGYMSPGASNRSAAQSTSPECARWGWLHCFSYGADLLLSPGTCGTGQSAPSGPRRMTNSACFSY